VPRDSAASIAKHRQRLAEHLPFNFACISPPSIGPRWRSLPNRANIREYARVYLEFHFNILSQARLTALFFRGRKFECTRAHTMRPIIYYLLSEQRACDPYCSRTRIRTVFSQKQRKKVKYARGRKGERDGAGKGGRARRAR